tara:strand:- start:1261 stop:2004 length:744 start_codon:yes stop_codon:yes gene_type:complete
MIKLNLFFFTFLIFTLNSCVSNQSAVRTNKKFYSSTGFALIYDENLYKNGILKKSIKNNEVKTMHAVLKFNTKVKIVNPENNKFIETKISKKATYPNLFNIVISQEIAKILDLDTDNPFVEVLEIKKNKTFIAKKSNIFDEEKRVAQTAPIDEIVVNNLSKTNLTDQKSGIKKNFFIIINDFYYSDSATNLKKEIISKKAINNIFIEKINDAKYRLSIGPFKNFKSLKSVYISLNNLGFDDLNIYKK